MIRRMARKTVRRKILTFYLCTVIFVFTAGATMTVQPKQAHALICCVNCCTCLASTPIPDLVEWFITWISINIYIFIRLLIHQLIWFDIVYWQQVVLPGLMQVGISLSAVGTYQVMILGMFIDAKEQLETQRLLQQMQAKTHKDYHTSVGMCEFGTRVTALASSERRGEVNARILSERSTDRFLGSKDTAASKGVVGDVAARMHKFRTAHCDIWDNDGGLSEFCPQLAVNALTAEERERFNADIDYQRTIQDPLTIDVDFVAAGEPTDQQENIFAMANNLYGFDSFENADHDELAHNPDDDISSAQQAYLDLRSVVAKTKVAENSFNALVAMKARGAETESRQFIDSYLRELGMPQDEIERFLGEAPSYYALMEILTKKAYQTPLFYTNLQGKPTDVKRKKVAMQAVGLMQKFDLLKSYLRTEASLSVLLELTVLQLQRDVEDNILAYSKETSVTQD